MLLAVLLAALVVPVAVRCLAVQARPGSAPKTGPTWCLVGVLYGNGFRSMDVPLPYRPGQALPPAHQTYTTWENTFANAVFASAVRPSSISEFLQGQGDMMSAPHTRVGLCIGGI